MTPGRHFYNLIFIAFAAALLFIPSLGRVHLFDWDEINFAESAREMLITKEYFRVQINFQPFWEKPPFFIWLQALSMQLFGINEFAARLPNAIIGIITLVLLYKIGTDIFDQVMGWCWVMVYAGSFLPHLYFKSGIIDPTFNLFIFLGIFYLFRAGNIGRQNNNITMPLAAGFFAGMAILTKGPVGILIILLTGVIYLLINKFKTGFRFESYLVFGMTALIVASAWFASEVMRNGTWFIQEFITYQIRLFKTRDAGHGGPFIYHFIVLYVGCFPGSIFIFNSFRRSADENLVQKSFRLWMIISFWVVLILFSIVKTKIVHYSSFCYFPITFLAALAIRNIFFKQQTFNLSQRIQLAVLGGIISVALIVFPLLLQYKESWIPKYGILINDAFALANLQAHMHWTGFEWLIGIGYFLLIILCVVKRKQGLATAVALFIGTMFVITFTLNFIVPNIERFSQGAAIDFFISKKRENAYVSVYGYKSYAHLFYTQKQPVSNPSSISEQWLLHGPIDKPAYFVSKVTNRDLQQMSHLQNIGNKNGFVFYKRLPEKLP